MSQTTLMSIDEIIERIKKQLNDKNIIPIIFIAAQLDGETCNVKTIEFMKIGNRNMVKILQHIITEISKEIPTEEN